MIIIVSCRIWELLTDNERWRAVLEVMLRKAAYALAVVRGVRDPSAEGNRYHNKRFVALATEIGLAGPERPEKWSADQTARLTDETTAACADVISAIDSARLSLPAGRSRRSAG